MKTSTALVLIAVGAVGLWLASNATGFYDTTYSARRIGGLRTKPIRLIVVHLTEIDGPAELGAIDQQTTLDLRSSHLVVGEDKIFRTVDDDVIAFGAMVKGAEANDVGLHVAVMGRSAWTKEQWKDRDNTLDNLAEALKGWAKSYGVPLVLLSDEALKRGDAGMATPAQIARVLGTPSWGDPGAGFPLDEAISRAGGR